VERESVERAALVRRSDALTLYAPLPPCPRRQERESVERGSVQRWFDAPAEFRGKAAMDLVRR